MKQRRKTEILMRSQTGKVHVEVPDGSRFSTYVSVMIHAPDICTNNMPLFMKAESIVFHREVQSVPRNHLRAARVRAVESK